ncbi:hypothetical protein [Dankookia sp. P2]|uniref:hypothetical protein n=1 Tax=Dankookia sp. P2 TaxID=3423955 RepID=UPI003D664476
MTSGLSAKRGSARASGTTKIRAVSSAIACAQKAQPRGVSRAARPMRALNHCRVSSMKETSAISVPKRSQASIARRLNGSSSGVSRMR